MSFGDWVLRVLGQVGLGDGDWLGSKDDWLYFILVAEWWLSSIQGHCVDWYKFTSIASVMAQIPRNSLQLSYSYTYKGTSIESITLGNCKGMSKIIGDISLDYMPLVTSYILTLHVHQDKVTSIASGKLCNGASNMMGNITESSTPHRFH